ncbi:hypothetical protein IMZ48_06885, partial [Candidatus Bathyarchaeota archaeon]|nr:hypothetical protein [Candidatus Bathyarchaeota archaeon]
MIGFQKELIVNKANPGAREVIGRKPIRIPSLRNVTHLSAGSNHVLALTREGTVYAWGIGDQGELGRRLVFRHRYESLTPHRVIFQKNKITAIFAGFCHNFAIDKSGRVFSWGLNNYGQTGVLSTDEDKLGKNMHVSHPARVDILGNCRVKYIAAGLHHSVACTEEGRVIV